MSVAVRKNGVLMLVVGAAGTALLAGLAVTFGVMKFRGAVFLVAVPVAVMLAGLAQCIGGVGIRDLASRWDSLQGWQRGLLGLLVVVAFIGLIFLLFLAALALGWLPGT